MTRKLLLVAACLLSPFTFAQAQVPANSPIKITGIEIEKNALTPEFTIGVGPQKKAKSQMWLWVETSFTYTPTARNAPPLDDLKLTYYILLNDTSATNRLGTLLVGSVTHTGISPGGPNDVHHSVMLVSPQVLKRYFDGKVPSNIQTAAQAIGVTATVQGQLVAELSIGKGQGRTQWWNQFQQGPPGLVLSKDQTPFAPLFYDYFEATKAQPPGAY
jgi:hypothetical protein